MVFINKRKLITITWQYCRISERLININIKNKILKINFFRKNGESKKTVSVTKLTSLVTKVDLKLVLKYNRWKADHFNSYDKYFLVAFF